MRKLIIIKYGELSTKKGNINFFIKTLKTNIENSLKNLEYSIEYDNGRMFIFGSDLETIKDRLSYVFGIHEIDLGYELDDNSLDNIEREVLNILEGKDITSFKVVTKRSYKEYPLTSMEISSMIGSSIVEKYNFKVDVHDPDVTINIEVRMNKSYIYFESISGLNGYPVGVQGKGLLMLSGGIDSPVAGYLAIKRGVRIEAIYFESPPHTSTAALEKVRNLSKILSKYSGYIKLHIINFTEIQESIYKNIPKEYLITIMRRMMYRIAEIVAKKNKDLIIINGESIGQVASQTLTSMSVINEVVDIPVIRPVACLDKLEIIDIAKEIKTYDVSILPYEDCCTIFVPEHPVINPSLSLSKEYESLIDWETLIDTAIKNEVVERITLEDKKFSDIL